MTKLQMIRRGNGNVLYSLNLPIAHIKDLDWQKSDKLSLEVGKVRGRDVIIIFREDIEHGGD